MASIESRPNGSHRIVVFSGYDNHGKKQRYYKTVAKKELDGLSERQKQKQLTAMAVLFEKAVEDGTYLDGERITLEDFIKKWLKDYAEKHLAPGTLKAYLPRIHERIIPALGHMKMAKIQPHHIMEFYNDTVESGGRLDSRYRPLKSLVSLLDKPKLKDIPITSKTRERLRNGEKTTRATAEKLAAHFGRDMKELFEVDRAGKTLSDKTVKHHHDLLSSIFGTAAQWNVIVNNPVSRVRPPKVAKKIAGFYDEQQVVEMFSLLEREPLKYKTAIYLAVDVGLRTGELTGLEWPDIDFESGRLAINKQRQYVHGYGTITKTPKTESGTRYVTVSDMVIGFLKAYKAEQNESRALLGDGWANSDIVFVHDNGKPMHPHRPYKWFMDFLKKNNLPKITFHALRHTNASLLIAQGVDIVTLSGRLGHADKNITLNTYSHIISAKEKLAANMMNDFYSKHIKNE